MMVSMSNSEELLREARRQNPPLPKKPRRKTAVVACMDTRVDPWKIVGAEAGDVHTIRNAGAIVTDDVVRSLIVSTQLLGVDRVQVVRGRPQDLDHLVLAENDRAHGLACFAQALGCGVQFVENLFISVGDVAHGAVCLSTTEVPRTGPQRAGIDNHVNSA